MHRRTLVGLVRRTDRWVRRRLSERRRVLLDVRTPMNLAVMMPIARRMSSDPRVRFYIVSSEDPALVRDGRLELDDTLTPLDPAEATWRPFDACVVADLVWTTLKRGAPRVLLFHGVAGKYGDIYDAPTDSMRAWDRIFFINRRRLANHVRSGAIDADSPAALLIGYPKLDCLVDGTLVRGDVLRTLGIPSDRRTVLYAPTWSRFSSLNAMGEAVVRGLVAAGYSVIVKLHDRSRDPREENSGGIDWMSRIEEALQGRGILAHGSDATPLLAAADVLVTDHSSVGFEFMLTNRPVVRIHMPALLSGTRIDPAYVSLLSRASLTASTPAEVIDAVAHALRAPEELSAERAAVVEELFHAPGSATDRAVAALYDLIELEPPHGTATT